MPTNLPIIEGQYLRDILAQPKALADTLANLVDSKPLHPLVARIHKAQFKSIVLTGMGSSFHALHPLHNQLIQLGLSAIMVETSELLHYKSRLFDSKNLLVAVSQSGQSIEIVRLLRLNRRRSPVIAVTNTIDSPLATNAEAVILTQAGLEFSVSCKTYVSTVMALQWIADLVAQRDLRRSRRELAIASGATETYLSKWRDHVQQLADSLRSARNLFFIGRGNSLAAVGTSALTVKESAHFAAEGLSSAAFRHGPLEMLNPETFVVVFGGDRKAHVLNENLLQEIRAHGGSGVLISPRSTFSACILPTVSPSVSSILEILPVQMITLALASLAGREAGRFDFATKITTKE